MSPRPPLTVLLADDHAVVRDGLRALLEAQGDIRVVALAGDGREAVRLARERRPSVAVLDIDMPGLNGIAATPRLLEASPATKVVILSMHADSEYLHNALRAGASGYVLKESAGQEVAAAVREAALGRRYFSRKVGETPLGETLLPGRDQSPLARLSEREREVLQLTVEGRTAAQVAQILELSPKTVETYRSRVLQKLGLSDLPALVKFAVLHGLTPLE